MLLFRALAKNMAPMTNADESPYAFLTEHFSLYSIYSLFPLLWETLSIVGAYLRGLVYGGPWVPVLKFIFISFYLIKKSVLKILFAYFISFYLFFL